MIKFIKEFEHGLDRKRKRVHGTERCGTQFDALGAKAIVSSAGIAVDEAHADKAHEISMSLAWWHAGGIGEHF